MRQGHAKQGRISKGMKKRSKKVVTSRNKSRPDRQPDKTGSTDLERDQVFLRMGSWELDLSSGIFHCSPDLQELLKFGQEEKKYSLNDYLEKIHPDDRRTFLQEIERPPRNKPHSPKLCGICQPLKNYYHPD